MSLSPSPSLIAGLRSRIDRLTVSSRVLAGKVAPFGDAEIDSALPWGGLPAGSLHDLIGPPQAVTGFLAAYLGQVRRSRPVLWITPEPQFHAPAFAAYGFDHRRLTVAWTRRAQDRLLAFEDALRSPGYAAVVAEVDGPDLAASRRLQAAAASGQVLGFLLRRDHGASAALTRWQIRPSPSDGRNPRWQVAFDPGRAGRPKAWLTEWNATAGQFTSAEQTAAA
ncbi:hypothetical protein [Ferrovibrio sp.]|uniref:ImuA family protein n=1 Tax=Ferrovibrio sp. TaxID=1917215 RepID=UPI00311F6EF9